jgi:O-antigen/teichoic acid export membrane protein
MPPSPRWRALLVEPVTRYQVRLVPVVILGGLAVWLVGAALWAGHWGLGLGALAVALAWATAWTLLRRRRLQRYDVLPRSDRQLRALDRREGRRERKATGGGPSPDPGP